MNERERILKTLHNELHTLYHMDLFPSEGVYEENFTWYVYCCALQGIITNRLFSKYDVSFPLIPYPQELSKGFSSQAYSMLHWQFECLDFNDCIFAFGEKNLPVTFLGVDLDERELSLLSLPQDLRRLIRNRWVYFGCDIVDVEMDMIIEIPGLKSFLHRKSAGLLSKAELALLSLCLKILPDQRYTLGPVILLPEGCDSGYVHIFFFCSKDTPFSLSCYMSRSIFFAVYVLSVLTGVNQVKERRIAFE